MASIISGMAFVRLSAPDLDRMEAFLTDFGMVRAHRDERRLYMRGAGATPYLHVTEKGEAGAIGFAYHVDGMAALEAAVSRGDADRIEDLDGPGGGRRVRMRDPNGCCVELVCGRAEIAAEPPRPAVRPPDGISRRVGAARVIRIAHTATMTPKPVETLAWYQEKLGVIPTDELFIGNRDNVLGQFDRLDRGEELVDHHIVFVIRGASAGMHHVSYQVEGIDDIFFGFDHMEKGGQDHVRGIGRHALGSQIFDYWMSPFNQMHEHWFSTEKMNAESGMNYVQIGEGMVHDTGAPPPERFVKQATPYLGWPGER
ncbi:MAG TPA: VOC family protein [Hyphomicrobiales bacterium]|nr:VOC family protein [Hyphomicrobiales bacterium]